MEGSQNELMNMINNASMGFRNSFSDQIPATFSLENIFDMRALACDHDQNNFMSFFDSSFPSEDYFSGYSLYDILQSPPLLTPPPPPPPSRPLPGSTEVVYTPVTPNSSSLSLSSNEAANDEDLAKTAEETEQENLDDESKNLTKPKRKNRKRERPQRTAFLVKEEKDQLDDGYRWRKYGQKAVKNSPFPRSYYRCTTPACGVKKRIERSYKDPSFVVTTYEGRHMHPVPTLTHAAVEKCIMKKSVQLEYVKTRDQAADIFTKPLKQEDFARLRILIGVTRNQV